MLAAALAVAATVAGFYPNSAQAREGAVNIVSHEEHVRDGAVTRRIEIEDGIVNETGATLEARYTFRLPPGAALTGVALDVNGAFVDGEVVPDQRGEEILREVEAASVPRDPALVARLPDGTVQVKIFPVPAYEHRRIRLTVQALQTGAARDAAIAIGREGFVLRMPFMDAVAASGTRAIVFDSSHARTDAALERQTIAVRDVVARMPEDAPFVVLACDTVCDRFPESGVEKKGDSTAALAEAWLRARKRGGAWDVVGALREAARTIDGHGRITLVGSGRGTAGILGRDATAAAAARTVGSTIAFEAVPVDDKEGDLSFLQGALAREVQVPRGLHTTSRRVDGDTLVLVGAQSGYAEGAEVTMNGRSYPLRRAHEEAWVADALFFQSKIDSLEEKRDDVSLANAGAIGRAHRLLAQRASWIVLESEEMFAQYGIARASGAKRAPSRPSPPKEPPPPPGTHRPRAVAMRMMSAIVVSSRLPAETIQYTIHKQHRRFRGCYEAGLRAFPTLAGRVAVRFVISPEGDVVLAQDGGSDLPDREVVKCMVDVMRELSFAPQESGSVTVTYPFVLTPEEGTSDERPLFQMRTAKPTPSPHDLWTMRRRAEASPDDVALREELGRWLALSGDARNAARAYDELADFVPYRADVHAHAAVQYLRAGDFGRAAAHVASALELAGVGAIGMHFPEMR